MRLNEAAKQIGVSPITLRYYCNQGRIKYSRTPGGQRTFKQEDINDFLGIQTTENPDNIAYYIRVSDGNATALTNQLKELTDAYGPNDNVYKDRASGLSEQRRGLKRLIRDVEKGKIQHVKITYEDRLTRFGFSYLEHIINTAGGDIEVLHAKNETPHEELMQDFMSLIASFSGKFYKMRSIENQHRLLSDANDVLEAKDNETV